MHLDGSQLQPWMQELTTQGVSEKLKYMEFWTLNPFTFQFLNHVDTCYWSGVPGYSAVTFILAFLFPYVFLQRSKRATEEHCSTFYIRPYFGVETPQGGPCFNLDSSI